MSAGSFYFDPDGSGLEVFLGSMEARLMELAWKHGDLTVKKALSLLGTNSRPAYTTVMTVLSRLADKGLLVREKEGRHFAYRASVDRETFLADRIRRVKTCLKKNFPA